MIGKTSISYWCALAFAAALGGAPQLTTIQDVLYKADGTRFNGMAIIEWKGFDAADTTVVPTQMVTVQIRSGNLRVDLAPTTGVAAGAYYSVKYNSDGRVQFSETWAVRPSASPLRLRDVRIMRDSTTSGSGGEVTLGGGPAFVDGEIPAGLVDGSNVTFMLAQTPVPAASLALYRNGVLQKASFDFTLSGNTVTFAVASVPRAGDVLLASYRLTDPNNPTGAAGGSLTGMFPNPLLADGVVYNSNVAPAAGISESKLALSFPTHSNAADAQVLCGATGTATSSSGMVQLGQCVVPASALSAGGRIAVMFDVSHEGNTQAFAVQVKWGSNTVLSRGGTSGETALGGRVELGLSAGRVQWTALHWGALSTVAGGAGWAADSLASPVTISLEGQLGGTAADTVTLRGFTVVKYPAK